MKNGLMISCEDATQLVVMSSGEKLKFYDKMRLKAHLMMCKFCSRFEEQNRVIDQHIKKLNTIPAVEMPKEAKSRIAEELEKTN